MTTLGTPDGSRRATLVAVYATLDAGRIAWSAVRALPVSVSLLCLRCAAPLESTQTRAERPNLTIEGDLLTSLAAEGGSSRHLLVPVAADLRRLGVLQSNLDDYVLHLTRGHAVLVAHGVEAEIERVYRTVRGASLAIHHVSLA